MEPPAQIESISSEGMAAATRDEVYALCRAAYEEEIEQYFVDVGPGLHLLGRVDGVLVSHAMIVERFVQVDGLPMMRTGYVELVATHPTVQGRGYGRQIMRALVPALHPFDLAALSPSMPEFYARLGWEAWRGPLFVRTEAGLVPAPDDEEIMILRLPRTPRELDLAAPLSIEWRAGEVF